MWILEKEDTRENIILLPCKAEYMVGRAGADLVLKDDLSISRTHATIHIDSAGNKLQIEDTGSKYGTFCDNGIADNKDIAKNQRIELKNGSTVRFGVMKHIWTISHVKSITLASALTRRENQELEKVISSLGGKIAESWNSNCTHLTMNEFSVTVKLLYALLEQLPVVTCDYWTALFKIAKSGLIKGTALPRPEQYQPKHPAEMDLSLRTQRKTLFTGMTFIVMNRKHFDTYAPIIKKAGGICKDLNSGVKKTFLTKDNVVVVQYVTSSQSQVTETVNNISAILEQNLLRIIPEYEIGLAILHCSTEKYCNPRYKLSKDIVSTQNNSDRDLPSATEFVNNTEEASAVYGSSGSEVIVPETEGTGKTQNKSSDAMPINLIPNIIAIDVDDDDEEESQKMPRINITESHEKIESQNKNKRKQPIYESDEDSDLELFQYKKKPNLEVNGTSKSAVKRTSPRGKQTLKTTEPIKPNLEVNEETSKTATKRTSPREKETSKTPDPKKPNLDVDETTKTVAKRTSPRGKPTIKTQEPIKPNLEVNETSKTASKWTSPRGKQKSKTTEPIEEEPTTSHSSTREQTNATRKRIHIAVIRDDDDEEEDDFFNFGDVKQTSKKPRLSGNTSIIDNDDDNSDDELFGFKKTTKANNNNNNKSDSIDVHKNVMETEKDTTCNSLTKPKSTYAIQIAKQLPRKINIVGWLTNIKLEDNVSEIKKEESLVNGDNSLTQKEQKVHDEWYKQFLNSPNGACHVRKCPFNISVRSRSALDDITDASTVISASTNGRKNFKTFVKQRLVKY